MSFADVVAGQLRCPSGPLAPLAARSLNRRNHNIIGRTIEALDVRPHHCVLDVGFGGGISIGLLAAQLSEGMVAGVDPSREMVRRARRRYSRQISDGRVAVEEGSVEALPFPPGTFDRLLSCNTIYFWDSVTTGLNEMHRVLVPSGIMAMAMMPKPVQQSLGFDRRGYGMLSHNELMDHLAEAGFSTVGLWPAVAPNGPRWIVTAQRS